MVRNLVIAAMVIGTASLPRSSAAQAPSIPPQVVVSGTGESRVTPDRATIMLGVQSRATTAAAAAADNARRQKAILDTLKAIGLGSEQLSTENYNVSPEMTYPQGGTPRVVGYIVTNTVRADVRKLDDVARVIDASLAKGANEISSLQFYSSKADSARRAALAAAVADARADAEVLAKAAGGTLGQLLELSTSESPIRPVPVSMRAMAAAPAPKTPIEPGQQTISAVVTARWALDVGARR
jgi:uncharacterized protein YggE